MLPATGLRIVHQNNSHALLVEFFSANYSAQTNLMRVLISQRL
jgi:hypothetical protein